MAVLGRGKKVRVIGLGNPLRGDDGVGCLAIDELGRQGLPEMVELIDLGTGGINLLTYLEDIEAVILIDAVDSGQAPGTLMRLEIEELLDTQEQTFLLPHEGNLGEVLRLSQAMGPLPKIVFFGLQVESVSLGTGLSDAVSAAFPQLLQAIEEELSKL